MKISVFGHKDLALKSAKLAKMPRLDTRQTRDIRQGTFWKKMILASPNLRKFHESLANLAQMAIA